MPANAGRKPCYRNRQRKNCESDILIDRTEQVTSPPSTSTEGSSRGISFTDPRATSEKEYELHIRSKLPKLISKCQGKCGKPIAHGDILIVRSYGLISWTNKKTGKENQKYGPMYIHFKEECLKNYSELFYPPGESFDYSKFKIDPTSRIDLSKTEIDFLNRLGIL